jgi:hypothetical protein
MSITMLLSLLICVVGLGLVAAGMALPLRLLPEETSSGPRRGPAGLFGYRHGVHGDHSRFSGDSQARLSP